MDERKPGHPPCFSFYFLFLLLFLFVTLIASRFRLPLIHPPKSCSRTVYFHCFEPWQIGSRNIILTHYTRMKVKSGNEIRSNELGLYFYSRSAKAQDSRNSQNSCKFLGGWQIGSRNMILTHYTRMKVKSGNEIRSNLAINVTNKNERKCRKLI